MDFKTPANADNAYAAALIRAALDRETLLAVSLIYRTLLAFTAIGITTAALPAFGYEFEPVRVTVPFAFMAGRTTLPAGDYTVTETETHAVMIRGNRGGVILLGQAGTEAQSDRNSLTFERTDVLKSVRSAWRPASVLSIATETEK
ncbi:MAG: hypothetical protein ABJC09_14195 [Terriglobia bacterium]